MMHMYEPYVQDTAKWVTYYAQSVHSKQAKTLPDAETSAPPNAGSLSEIGSMTVTRVEPKGPLPPVPQSGSSLSVKNVTPTQTAIHQATFDAMREKIENPSAGTRGRGRRGSRGTSRKTPQKRSTSTSAKVGKSKKQPKKQLYGTPQDIFKSATGKNGSKKKKKT